jgi:hypothetical protein
MSSLLTAALPAVIPDPPLHMATPYWPNLIFSGAGITVATVVLGYAILVSGRTRSPLPLLVYLSGGISALILEPALDVNGGCWWPRIGGWDLYNVYGTPIPAWAVAAYFWFVGGQALLIWQALDRWPSGRTVWRCWLAVIGSNFLLETPGLIMGVYRYWGQQPLETPWGLPLWWLPVNACMPLVPAAIVYLLRHRLTGVRMLLAIPLVPLGAGTAEGAASGPAWLVLNTADVPWVLTQIAGLAVFGLAASLVWAIAGAVDQAAPTRAATGAAAPDEAFTPAGR